MRSTISCSTVLFAAEQVSLYDRAHMACILRFSVKTVNNIKRPLRVSGPSMSTRQSY